MLGRRLVIVNKRLLSMSTSKQNDLVDVIVLDDDEEEEEKENKEIKMKNNMNKMDQVHNVNELQKIYKNHQITEDKKKYYYDTLSSLGLRLKLQNYKGIKWDARAVICPYCKPHKNNPSNLNTLSISTSLERFNCFRCGTSGSLEHLINDLRKKS